MRLTLHTDYALRVMVHAGMKDGQLVTINEIAALHGISKNHLTKVVHQLGRSGYLETVRGKYGGLRLTASPDDIRLGEFVHRVEEDFAIARCMREEEEAAEICILEESCVARQAFADGVSAFVSALNNYTLADMIAAERCGTKKIACCG